jgi:excisionase family DNA binding protein
MATGQTLFDFVSPPRLLTREQAARYCGVGTTTLTDWIERGIIPGPVPGTHRWDRKAVDAFLDILSRLDDTLEGNALDRWRASRHARQTEGGSSS